MPEVALAMDDDKDDKIDIENSDEVANECYCDMCQGNGWVYDDEDGGTMCCPECEEE